MDDTEIYQTLPWNYQGWHAGGNANNELIGIEICEPKDYSDKEYFEKVKNKILELCLYLCKEYSLEAETVTTHCEGYAKKGKLYASNHSDIHHWWERYHNYTIDDFRKELKDKIKKNELKEFQTGTEALDYLVSRGRINDKEYWLKVLETTRQVEYLFIKWAKDVEKID